MLQLKKFPDIPVSTREEAQESRPHPEEPHFSLCPGRAPTLTGKSKQLPSESAFHIKWPKYWSFRFSISPSNVYSDLISFRMEWLRLLVV